MVGHICILSTDMCDVPSNVLLPGRKEQVDACKEQISVDLPEIEKLHL